MINPKVKIKKLDFEKSTAVYNLECLNQNEFTGVMTIRTFKKMKEMNTSEIEDYIFSNLFFEEIKKI